MSPGKFAFWIGLAIFLAAARAATAAPVVSVVGSPDLGQPARHGLEGIAAALQARQVAFELVGTLAEAKGGLVVVVGRVGDPVFSPAPFADFVRSVPTNAEALTIQKLNYEGRPVWAVAGADERGLMYAELEVAERIGWGTNADDPLSEVRATVEKPDVANRGITLFTMNRAYWESRFYDEAYWQRYFDTLAQNRFNVITVIFGYEDGGFLAPCYPYFFDVPEFPGVKMIGITAEQQRQNVAALNRLVQMAHDHGVRFEVGIWDHIYRGGVQNGGSPGGNDSLRHPTPSLVWGMNATNLISYTQVALKEFLHMFPGIDGIQFRMHDESGLKVSEQTPFWQATFRTVRETRPELPLDLRAKGLTAAEIQSAEDAGVNFHISTKYWMEQMGLPFHPMHVNPRDQASRRHGYADLLVYPQTYKVTWQLWNGGPSRVWLWGDPEYARRFVATTHLYDGDSLVVDEPLATKMEGQPQDAPGFDLLKPSARYYDYEFERYWHFFQVFGRIGYDPNTSAEVWDREFARRFGPAAGPLLETALHRASWILPRIIASSYPYTGFPMTDGWAEKQHLGDLPVFAKATLSDVQLFENFDEEAQLLLANGETAKVRPQETSRWFADTAATISAQLALAEENIGTNRSREYAATVMDLKMVAALARYHAARIPAAVNYRLYDRTQDPRALEAAIAGERQAVAAWRELVDAAGDTYAPDLMFGARSRNLCGHWRDELVSLEHGLITLEAERRAATFAVGMAAPLCKASTGVEAGPVISHEGVTSTPAGQPLTIRAHVTAASGIKWVQVLFRRVDQTQDYTSLTLSPVDDQGNFAGTIPAAALNPRFDFMYFLQTMDNAHHGVMYPDFNRQTPYYFVRLER